MRSRDLANILWIISLACAYLTIQNHTFGLDNSTELQCFMQFIFLVSERIEFWYKFDDRVYKTVLTPKFNIVAYRHWLREIKSATHPIVNHPSWKRIYILVFNKDLFEINSINFLLSCVENIEWSFNHNYWNMDHCWCDWFYQNIHSTMMPIYVILWLGQCGMFANES